MLLADGFLRCDHPECIYFFKDGISKRGHMVLRHECSDPHECEACVERNFHIDNVNVDNQSQSQSKSKGGKRQREIISGKLVPVGMALRKNTKTTNNTNGFVKPNQVGVWNERMFNVIKCPHIGCEDIVMVASCLVTVVIMMNINVIGYSCD
ncbi:hypothetical protein SAMD00019534_091960 [Acytostelium subglobosum LB1]|uniref:hypothetical protein n=1 Tax=Acytostelium subglobosum LB1 TaxID=1410327 RepID=UPI000644892E|nr:hypothetical protein SAMD00019534_091960 [Acytostelium subglobosum LB1]GAM26021.1 hypothetical protein SAMD00019534_091960 [Acytostelium subglobosum LB1]|eukprot:XP_012751064.1 hypothetical protein SAMD00019534_091960 [Acytostelium subglobosum LB1]